MVATPATRSPDTLTPIVRPPVSEDFPPKRHVALASFHLEQCLGAYPVDFASCWTPPDYWDADDVALEMPDHPNVWTDGSREDFSSLGGFEVAGAGVYLPASELAFENLVWCTVEEYGDARLERCRAFLPVPGVMQTVQRAEFWGAIVALQAYWPCHLGIDNLNVARSIHWSSA